MALKKECTQCRPWCGRGVNGRPPARVVISESQFDCHNFFLPLYIGLLLIACPPHWWHDKTSITNIGLNVAEGSIALDRAPEDRGWCQKEIWLWRIFLIFTLDIYIHQKIFIACPYRRWHRKTSIPNIGINVGKRWFASERASSRQGRQERRWRLGTMVLDCVKIDLMVSEKWEQRGKHLSKGGVWEMTC